MAVYVSPEQKGSAVGGDWTTAMQAAFDDGRVVVLQAGTTYAVTNLSIPNREGFRLIGNGATIQKISGDDNHYLCASAKYLANTNSAQDPTRIEDVVFDANDVAEYAFIHQSWNSDLDIECLNATKSGLMVTAETRDSTALSGTLVNNRIRIRSHDNGEYGVFVQDSARNKATDGTILPGSKSYSNGSYAVSIEPGAGWEIAGLRTYANGGGLIFNGVGAGTRIHDCYIDDGDGALGEALPTGETYSAAVEVNAHLTVGLCPVTACSISGPVRSLGQGDTAPYGIWSENNRYIGSGHIYQGVDNATRITYSVNDSFVTSTPFQWASGTTAGKITANQSLKQSDGTWLDGAFDGTS